MDAHELLTLDDVARALGVSRKTVANRVARRDIPAVRPLGRWRVQGAVLTALCAGVTGEQLWAVARGAQAQQDGDR